MGLFRPHIVSGAYSLGIWEIDETLIHLLEAVKSLDIEVAGQLAIKSELKKKQWLAARLLLRSMQPEILTIGYLDSKAPYIDGRWEISMTHSGQKVGVMLSKVEIPGIDIQQMSEKIIRVKEKFTSIEERNMIGSNHQIEKLHLLWCSKEAIYKKCRNPGLIFSEDIQVLPFELEGVGVLNARVRLSGKWNSFNLQYEFLNDYALVYTVIG